MNQHLMSSADLTRDDVEDILETAESMHDVQRREVKKVPTLRGRTVINFFFEDSTRTRCSFEIAGKWMSADTINLTAKGSSTSKGESLRDTVRTVDAMAVDALVIRHTRPGPATRSPVGRAPERSSTPGTARTSTRPRRCSTPTRSARHLGDLDGRHVVIVGDLTHSRVFRSNVITLEARGARHRRRAADADAERDRRWSSRRRVRHVVGPRRGPRAAARTGRRCRDDAPRPAGADERRVLPDGPRVHRRLRADPRPAATGSGRATRRPVLHPGPMNRGPRDRRRRRRRGPVRRPRPGLRRRRGADGRALPPAGRRDRRSERMNDPADQGRPAARRAGRRPARRRRRIVEVGSLAAGADTRSSTPTAWSRCPAWSTSTSTCASRAARTPRPSPPARPPPPAASPRSSRWPTRRPVTDTAEAAERVLDLGRAARLVDVQPVGAVTKGLEGPGARRARPDGAVAARVRGLLRRRAVRPRRPRHAARAGVRQALRRRHLAARPGPALAGPDACCHEGELSGRLGLPGWPGIAEESIVARDVMLARHTGSRVHVAHVSTAGSVEVIRWAKAQGIDVTAEVTPHHLLLTTTCSRLRPGLQGQPPAAPDGGRRGAAGRGSPTARSTPSRPTTPRTLGTTRSTPSSTRRFGDARAGDGAGRRQRGDGPPGPARLGGVARVMSTARPGSPGLDDQGQPLSRGSPANVTLVDPDREVTSTATARRAVAQQPLARPHLHAGRTRRSTRGTRTTATDVMAAHRDPSLSRPGRR